MYSLFTGNYKSWLIGKDSDAGRDWGQEEKGMTEDEVAGWHHWLDGCEFEWTPGDGDGQGGLASCDSWGCKESDTTEQLNWTELNWYYKPLVYIFLYFFPPVEGKLLESKDFVCTSVPLEPWEKSVSVAWVNVWNHCLIPQRCLIEYYAPETSSNI